MADIETLKIADNNGSFIIINKSEFDATTQTEFGEKPVIPEVTAKPASATKSVSSTESK
jgi:hypothetical protein